MGMDSEPWGDPQCLTTTLVHKEGHLTTRWSGL